VATTITPYTTAWFRDITRSHHSPFGAQSTRDKGETIIINIWKAGMEQAGIQKAERHHVQGDVVLSATLVLVEWSSLVNTNDGAVPVIMIDQLQIEHCCTSG